MLNKTNRLTKRKEFNYVYKNGKKFFNNYLNLVIITTKLPNPRFGFVVSKKVGKAHIRNKVKRRISEIIRLNVANIDTKYNYIFVAKPTIVDLNYKQLETEVLSLLQKGSVWVK